MDHYFIYKGKEYWITLSDEISRRESDAEYQLEEFFKHPVTVMIRGELILYY